MVFDRPWKLRNHLERHNDVKNFICSEANCRKSYFSSSHLIRHMRTAHFKRSDTKEVFPCLFPDCDAVFNTKCGLRKHNVKHKTRFLCSRCKLSFRSEAIHKRHVKKCNQEAGTCSICEVNFLTKNDLKLHQQQEHTAQELAMFECAHCQCRFKKKYSLKRHLENIHGFEKIQIRLKHRPAQQPPIKVYTEASYYECAHCKSQFTKKRNLKSHIQIIHQASVLYLCEVPDCCDVFLYKRNLMAHVRCDHEKIRFQCGHSNCDANFKYKQSLIKHLRTHE